MILDRPPAGACCAGSPGHPGALPNGKPSPRHAYHWVTAGIINVSDQNSQALNHGAPQHPPHDGAGPGGEELFHKIFDEGPLGMVLANPHGTLHRVNATFCRMLGYTDPAELVGKHWRDLTHPQDVEPGQRAVHRLLAGQVPWIKTDKRYLRRDRSVFWGMLTLTMIRSAGGAPGWLLGMLMDVTDRKRSEEERTYLLTREQAARAEAEAANRRKDQFLAVLSHELRTPLTPVVARLELLKREPGLSASVRSGLEMIRRNVELEASLIDDLLDVTRIARGKLQLNMENVDVHEKVAEALAIYQAEIAAGGLSVTLDLAAQRHLVQGDPNRLEQVFWNLISNAVKYTPRGGRITVRSHNRAGFVPAVDQAASPLEGQPAPQDSLVVEIIDTGIGIEPSIMDRLFTAFEQGEQSLTRRYGGLGLGLSICRALVGMHGGAIHAQSQGAGHGATFTVELPLAAAAAKPAAAPEPQTALPPAPRRVATSSLPMRILLVEDNIDTLRLLSRLLRGMGHDVRPASSLQEARRQASSEFDLLISDIGLPDGSGWELMRQLRALQPVRGVALSGFSTEQDIQRSRDAGFLVHLTKPIDIKKLDAVIAGLAPRGPAPGEHPAGNPPSDGAPHGR